MAYSIVNEDFPLLLPLGFFHAYRRDHVESWHTQFFLGVDPALFLLYWAAARLQWRCFALWRFSLLRDAVALWFGAVLAVSDTRFVGRMLGFYSGSARWRHCGDLWVCRSKKVVAEIYPRATLFSSAGKR
jgi:hypothetical protein